MSKGGGGGGGGELWLGRDGKSSCNKKWLILKKESWDAKE
jgi:hypothetical protein